MHTYVETERVVPIISTRGIKNTKKQKNEHNGCSSDAPKNELNRNHCEYISKHHFKYCMHTICC